MIVPIPSPYSGKPIKAVSTDQRVLSLPFSLSMKTGRREFPIFAFGKIRITEVFFREVPFVELAVGEIPVVEGDVPNAEASHPWCADAELVPELFITEVERSVFEFGLTGCESRKKGP